MVNNQKKNRVLDIFYRAFKGEELSVSNLASEYEVSTKSITRDINEIKNFLADNRDVVGNSELLYSYQRLPSTPPVRPLLLLQSP